MKTSLRTILMLFLMFSSIHLYSNDLELTREFNLITSKNASGYLKPLFTSIGEGLNTSLFNSAYQSNGWTVGINFSFAGMFIPESHRSYNAELPDLYGSSAVRTAQLRNGQLHENLTGSASQPTIYGGESYSIFASPQSLAPPDSFYKSVGFIEGNDIGFMPAVPIVQLFLGIPTRTEFRFRFFTMGMQGSPITYYTIGLNQNIDKAFGINEPDDPFSFGITGAYHSISRDKGIDLSSLALGGTASYRFGTDFNVFGGLTYESLSGNILMVRKDFNPDDVLNSPYSEIRRGDNLKVDIESFNSLRFTAGASYDVSIFRFHLDFGLAAQPVINFGTSIKFFEHKEVSVQPKEYYIPEMNRTGPPLVARLETEPFSAKPVPLAILKEREWIFNLALRMNAITNNIEVPLDTIIIEEFESRQTRAILPYVFFGENESDIPDRYVLMSKEETSEFTYSELSGRTSLESYYHILNVIGYRLKEKPHAPITLTGTNNNLGPERNNNRLSRQRAENIKQYLVDVWDIDPARIKVEARNLPRVPSNNRVQDGQEENRRVEISSADLDIVAPVFIIDTILRIRPDELRYIPNIESEAGLSSWSINSFSGGVNLKSFSGTERIGNDYQWYIAGEGTKKKQLTDNLVTRFSAVDKENNRRDTILNHPIKVISIQEKRLNATRDTSLNVYNLILFEFDKSTLGESNRKIADFIKSELTPDTEVTILGFTDRIGDEAHNLRLSTARAESTGKALGGHPYKVIGVGKSKLIYDNDLPEGRFYCRTVIVEAKVPIN